MTLLRKNYEVTPDNFFTIVELIDMVAEMLALTRKSLHAEHTGDDLFNIWCYKKVIGHVTVIPLKLKLCVEVAD